MGSEGTGLAVDRQRAGADSNNILSEVSGLNSEIACSGCETNISVMEHMSNVADKSNSSISAFKKCLTEDAKNIVDVAERLIQADVEIAGKIKEAFQ